MATLGKYELFEEIGRGAMGVVHRGLDPIIGRDVAIKILRLSQLDDPAEKTALQQRLLREGRSAGILSHAGIVTIYEVVREGDAAYIVMEYVNGPSLENVLARPEVPGKDFVLGVVRQTAAALDYAHKRGIVHRDVKPSNLLITEDGRVKIADFGLAKISSSPKMTQTGSALGTPYYMAPEQIQGQPVDARIDQYALGVVAYQMLTGLRPFTADSISALFFKIVYSEPQPASVLNPTIGPGIEKVLARAMSKSPQQRFISCSDFASALEEACARSSGWEPRICRPATPDGTSPSAEANVLEGDPSQSTTASDAMPPRRAAALKLALTRRRVTLVAAVVDAQVRNAWSACAASVQPFGAAWKGRPAAFRYAVIGIVASLVLAALAGGIWALWRPRPNEIARPKPAMSAPAAVAPIKAPAEAAGTAVPGPHAPLKPDEAKVAVPAGTSGQVEQPRRSGRVRNADRGNQSAPAAAEAAPHPSADKPAQPRAEPLDLMGTPVLQERRKRTVLK